MFIAARFTRLKRDLRQKKLKKIRIRREDQESRGGKLLSLSVAYTYTLTHTSRVSDIFIRHQYYQRNIVIIEKSIPNFSKKCQFCRRNPRTSKVLIAQIGTLRNTFSRAKIYSAT